MISNVEAVQFLADGAVNVCIAARGHVRDSFRIVCRGRFPGYGDPDRSWLCKWIKRKMADLRAEGLVQIYFSAYVDLNPVSEDEVLRCAEVHFTPRGQLN